MATAKQIKFIEDIYKCVAKYAPAYNVKCYSAVIAQAICESGWGESTLSAKYHNYFGLKCGTLWKGGSVNMRTGEEYTPGVHTTISANFRTYSSMEEGVKGYFVFLFDGRTRYNNVKGVTDPQTYLERIKADGYATSSTYVKTNMSLVNTYGLRKYDPANKATETTTATTSSQRQVIVNTAKAWYGCKESDGSHKPIVDVYNKYLSTAVKFGTVNYRVSYSDSWCATYVSAVFIKAGLASLCPIECSCPRMIALAQKAGTWVENDAYVPYAGDIILYDWQDSGSGDNKGVSDHVGIVVSCDGSTIKVIEGNKNDAVQYREIKVNGRYIRGYVVPKYNDKAEPKTSNTSSTTSDSNSITAKNMEVVIDVLKGKYGNGIARKNNLEAAGENYAVIQAIVNDVVDKAQDVIAGKYGNGEERKARLGVEYDAVQYWVNVLLSE